MSEYLLPEQLQTWLGSNKKDIVLDDWNNKIVQRHGNDAPLLFMLNKFGVKKERKRTFGTIYSWTEAPPIIQEGFILIGAAGETGHFIDTDLELLGYSAGWTEDVEYIDGIPIESVPVPGSTIIELSDGAGNGGGTNGGRERIKVTGRTLTADGKHYTLQVLRGVQGTTAINWSAGIASGEVRRVRWQIMARNYGIGNAAVNYQDTTIPYTYQSYLNKSVSDVTTIPLETWAIADDPKCSRLAGEINRKMDEHVKRFLRNIENHLITNTISGVVDGVPYGKGLFGWIEDIEYIDAALTPALFFEALRPRFRKLRAFGCMPSRMVCFTGSKARYALNSFKLVSTVQTNTDVRFIGKSELFKELTNADAEDWMICDCMVTFITHPVLEYNVMLDGSNKGVEGQYMLFVDMDHLFLTSADYPKTGDVNTDFKSVNSQYYVRTEIKNLSKSDSIIKPTIEIVSMSYFGLELELYSKPWNTSWAIGFKTMPSLV